MKTATTLLVFCVGALLSLGVVMLYSAGLLRGGAYYAQMQLLWASAGVALAIAVAGVDYRWFKKGAWFLLAVAIVLLVLVLFEPKVKGARRWFDLGVVKFQPSELAKLALIIALARYGDRYRRFMPEFGRGLVIPGFMIAAVLGLIFVEPDRGATVLLGAVAVIMLVLAGARLRYLILPLLLGMGGLAFSIWNDPVRWRRIETWLNLSSNKEDGGFQVWRSIVGIGSGGIDGVGLGNGREKAYVPDHHTDFIFSIVGEELGLIATLATIVAFVVLVWCGLTISRRARDTFGFLLGSGITFLIGLQALINIGVVTGALPAKGLPLPFISYGGSNLLLMLGSIGILLSIARYARDTPGELPETNRIPDLAAAQLSS